jgi:flagellar motor switch/type III secretory pathway protein FliN
MRESYDSTLTRLGTILPRLDDACTEPNKPYRTRLAGELSFVRKRKIFYSMSAEIDSAPCSLPIWFSGLTPSADNPFWTALQFGSVDAFSQLNAITQSGLAQICKQIKTFNKLLRLKCLSKSSNEHFTGWIYSTPFCSIGLPDSVFGNFVRPLQPRFGEHNQFLRLLICASLEPVALSRKEFSNLDVGDCLLLQARNTKDSCRVLIGLRNNSPKFFGSYEKDFVMIEKELVPDEFETDADSDSDLDVDEGTFDEDYVLISGVLPPKALPLAELLALEVGSLINLEQQANEAILMLKVNSRTVGSGRLVGVGDRLAIQVTSLKGIVSESSE